MKRIRSLAGIFCYYDAISQSFLKVKSGDNKSIYFTIPQSNFSVLNGKVLGEEKKSNFYFNKSYI